jgi:hypothetical protein
MKSKMTYTHAEADEIVSLIKEKLKADAAKQKGIRAKIRSLGFWASEFGFRDGYTVQDFLSVVKIIGGNTVISDKSVVKQEVFSKPVLKKDTKSASRIHSDESYVIGLCDEVLKQKALRQHRFDFLRGDAGTRLPVDAYYPNLNLVIEFRERQHTEEVKFFDRSQTASGMGRGDQRKLYDQRRRGVLPKHGIKLIELGYDDFEYTGRKKLLREREMDLKVIIEKLK